MATTYQKIKDYKETQFSWTGNIPHDWEIEKVKAFFYFSKERASDKGNDILSLTLKGIKVRDISGNEGQLAATYENYSKLRKGDVVLNPMDLISGWVTDSDIEGIISPAYKILRLKKGKELNVKFISKYLQWHWLFEIFFPFGQGVSVDHRWTLGNDTLMNFPILVPPHKTQERIADFLDEKIVVIDTVIEKKQKLIELLKEQRAIIITKAVTKGLDSEVKMKDSGVEWIGEMPDKWKIKPIRAILYERKENNNPIKTNEILSLSMEKGVFPYSEKTGGGNKSKEDLSVYKLAHPGDIVVNSMNIVAGSVGLSHYFGAVSPVYYTLYPKLKTDFAEYFSFVFRSVSFQKSLLGLGNGILVKKSEASGKLNTIRLRIPMHKLRTVEVPYPDFNEQKIIINYVKKKDEEIINLISKVEFQIKLLLEYRASLIYNAVTGKITI